MLLLLALEFFGDLNDVQELKPGLERRKKLESSLKANRKRIATIDAILAKGEG